MTTFPFEWPSEGLTDIMVSICVMLLDLNDFCGDHDLFLRRLYRTYRIMIITTAMTTGGDRQSASLPKYQKPKCLVLTKYKGESKSSTNSYKDVEPQAKKNSIFPSFLWQNLTLGMAVLYLDIYMQVNLVIEHSGTTQYVAIDPFWQGV